MEEHECVAWSPNQEWMFKSIKVQPFFPSKEELGQKPIRPDEQLPFQPQQELFPGFPHPQHLPVRPGKPLLKAPPGKKKEPQSDEDGNAIPLNQPFTRPNPIVLNPREPYPPVQPNPIYPKGTLFLPPVGPDGKPDFSKPPVPHVRHPGGAPYPAKPVVTDPRKPVWPPTLFGTFGPTPPPTPSAAPKRKDKDSDEEDEEEEEEEEREDDKDPEEEGREEDEEEQPSRENEESSENNENNERES